MIQAVDAASYAVTTVLSIVGVVALARLALNRLARRVQHQHDFYWYTEPEGAQWAVFARCDLCGYVPWECTARSGDELRDELTHAFRHDQLSAIAYFTAPTGVPDETPA